MTKTINSETIMGQRKIEVKRTWEYVSILGNFIGYWRNTKAETLGGETYINLILPEGEKLFINGEEVNISSRRPKE